MEELFLSALEQLKKGQDIMLVTIIESKGSAPRGAGARMWVSSNSKSGNADFSGTIGGGIIESMALREAEELLQAKCCKIKEYNLGAAEVASIGMVCGGRIWISYFYIASDNQQMIELLTEINARYQRRENTWLMITGDEDKTWVMSIAKKGTNSKTVVEENAIHYTEHLIKSETVYVFGGGHVAQALVPLLVKVGFSCVVFDDRKEFASVTHFPEAAEVHCGDFRNIDKTLTIRKDDYVVIMTRGHVNDFLVQGWALAHQPYYIGVIGSRKKIAYVTSKLLEQGFTKEAITACHTPIGLDIGAETPAEIAVSVAGELIQVRSQKPFF